MDVTHEVFNQPQPLVDYNLFEGNQALRDALKLNAPGLATAELAALGAHAGQRRDADACPLANMHTPQLHSHDRFGRRVDQVEFHPSYHALMTAAIGAGLHGTPWTRAWRRPRTLRAPPASCSSPSSSPRSCARSP